MKKKRSIQDIGIIMEEHKDEIIKRYQGGDSSTEIGKTVGVSGNTVIRYLKEWGIPIRESQRKKGKNTRAHMEANKDKIIQMYESGSSSPDVAKAVGKSPNTVLKYLREWGIPIRDDTRTTGKKRQSYAETHKGEIIYEYVEMGLSSIEIAERRELEHTDVLKYLKKWGVPVRDGMSVSGVQEIALSEESERRQIRPDDFLKLGKAIIDRKGLVMSNIEVVAMIAMIEKSISKLDAFARLRYSNEHSPTSVGTSIDKYLRGEKESYPNDYLDTGWDALLKRAHPQLTSHFKRCVPLGIRTYNRHIPAEESGLIVGEPFGFACPVPKLLPDAFRLFKNNLSIPDASTLNIRDQIVFEKLAVDMETIEDVIDVGRTAGFSWGTLGFFLSFSEGEKMLREISTTRGKTIEHLDQRQTIRVAEALPPIMEQSKEVAQMVKILRDAWTRMSDIDARVSQCQREINTIKSQPLTVAGTVASMLEARKERKQLEAEKLEELSDLQMIKLQLAEDMLSNYRSLVGKYDNYYEGFTEEYQRIRDSEQRLREITASIQSALK